MSKRNTQKVNVLNLFNSNTKFVIPIYQRAYAWGKDEIENLIDDLLNYSSSNYYLGTLIVADKTKDNCATKTYEVIDGQQRLTTLYLILGCLGCLNNTESLIYESRENATNTLKVFNKKSEIENEKLENNILRAIEIIKNKIENTELKEKLKDVELIIIPVHPKTNYNKCFEIMNSRGEQLSQDDVVKSILMGNIRSEDAIIKRKIFAEIWQACSNMDSYIQEIFSNEYSKYFFGENYFKLNSNLIEDNFKKCIEEIKTQIINKETLIDESYSIEQIIENSFNHEYIKDTNKTSEVENKSENKFQSIIDFPHFLLQSLRAFIKLKWNNDEFLEKQFDQNKIIQTFNDTLSNKTFENFFGLNYSKEDFSIDFIFYLLKNRFLFDNYILKREYKTNDELYNINDIKWSIKRPTNNLSNYLNTYNNNRIIMLQSLLRVTYTNPKSMQWINELLIELNKLYKNKIYNIDIEKKLENYIKEEIRDTNFYNDKNKKYSLGTETPHLVFNYLDYLLWKINPEKNNFYKNFKFSFRNSVEHLYPQNLALNKPEWKDVLNYFGNLCLVTVSMNSKLSNLNPKAKMNQYEKSEKNYSLKLKIMFDLLKKYNDWSPQLAKRHGIEMIELLKKNIDEKI